jgi:hypothetical protein
LQARALLAAAVLAGGLLASATPAAAAQTQSCQLSVSNFYMSIAMQTASARLDGCGSERIDNIEMQWASAPSGPFTATYPADYLSVSSDGKRAIAYFLDPDQRGYCRAKATAGSLTAYSPGTVSC